MQHSLAMSGKRVPPKSLMWIGFALLGAVGGVLLGHYVVGEDGTRRNGPTSYADRTGNPNAPGTPPVPIESCYDCSGGYGRGIRHNPRREARMDDAFRELGAVESDPGPEPTEDYRYGGRFDDPAAARTIVMQSPVQLTPEPAIDPPPVAETATAAPGQ